MTQNPSPDEVKQAALRILAEIAPEVDITSLKQDVSFRDQLDLDSMDFLNFIIALHEALHVEIREADYPKLTTLNGCVEHLCVQKRP